MTGQEHVGVERPRASSDASARSQSWLKIRGLNRGPGRFVRTFRLTSASPVMTMP